MNHRKILGNLILSLIVAHSLYSQKVLPVLNSPLQNRTTLANGTTESIDLNTIFSTEAIDDQVVRFTTQSSIGSLTLDFAMFSDRTPGTRKNFLNYVSDGDYIRSIIHRSVPGFVIQGGGFYDSNPSTDYFLSSVPTDPPIENEFGISNTLGTVSMAKVGNDPDSATSQWFISIGDNSENLDNQNGGFTVFARVTKSTLNHALSLGDPTNFPIWDAGGAFGNLPLNPDFDRTRALLETDFLLFTTVELVNIEASDAGTSTALTYSIVGNSNPDLVSASLSSGSVLKLNYAGSLQGSSTLTVRATDSVGNTVEDTFTVVILETFDTWQSTYYNPIELSDPLISGPEVDANGDGLTNLEAYLHGLNRRDYQQEQVIFSNTEVTNQSYASFNFPILNTISDITYTIEHSSDLGLTDDWSSVSFNEISRTSNGPVDSVSIRAAAPVGNANNFYRVCFTQTAP